MRRTSLNHTAVTATAGPCTSVSAVRVSGATISMCSAGQRLGVHHRLTRGHQVGDTALAVGQGGLHGSE